MYFAASATPLRYFYRPDDSGGTLLSSALGDCLLPSLLGGCSPDLLNNNIQTGGEVTRGQEEVDLRRWGRSRRKRAILIFSRGRQD
ncbi:hypothetical protein AVEN_106344-1 [Araneus ventricosus]|uniref:Uncharacterized protein n=1 Tax=Araneus ventricosus TaxID=182803 RepID=A0A4Y2ATH6_ARAVE|nr:hypothetical protein AVEN_106344-1 [Araneus ventricosus]